MTRHDYSNAPEYWSLDPATFDLWVAELGYAAAGKLMAACAAYFLHGTEPDEIKLTKSARNMFEAERGKLDRRRAMAMKSVKAPHKRSARANVENSENLRKACEKPEKSSKESPEKSTDEQTQKDATTSANANARQPAIQIQSQNPQTPAPSCGARGSGLVSRDEFAALLRADLGFATPNAYGLRARPSMAAGG